MDWFRQLLNKFKHKEHLPEYYVIPELQPYCTMFGSRLWGGSTFTSDVDFVMSRTNLQKVVNLLSELGIKYKVMHNSYDSIETEVIFKYKELKYSISVIENKSYYDNFIKAIPITTLYFKHNKKEAKVKKNRVKILEASIHRIMGSKEVIDPKLYKIISENYPEYLM